MSTQPIGRARDALRALLGAHYLLEAPEALAPFAQSWGGLWQGHPIAVALPESTAQLAELVRICAEARIPMVPQGGNTALTGSGTPRAYGGELLVSLKRMRKLCVVDAVNDTITLDAGIILAQAQAAAEKANRLLPISLAAEGSCQIGGLVSTNAGGTQVLRYGNMRQLVLGLEVVLPDGQILPALRGLRKDSAGYDLKQLFIGAEGTLGFITKAVLRLSARPVETQAAFVALPDIHAATALLACLRARLGERVSALELICGFGYKLSLEISPGAQPPLPQGSAWYGLIEISGQDAVGSLRAALEAALEEAFEQALITDAVIAKNESERRTFWSLRERLAEAQTHAGPGVKHDVSLPISALADFIAAAEAALTAHCPGIRLFAFGHVGDGNLHYNPIMPPGWTKAQTEQARPGINRIVHDLVASYGGSISAEHGIGQLRVKAFPSYKSPVELALMGQLKALLDPYHLMNPGKLLRPPA
nr:FAD-binding oxidoreductase [uncultured Acidocella sp.]